MSDEATKEQLREERDYYRQKAKKLEAVYSKLQENFPQVEVRNPTRRELIKGAATASLGAAGMYAFTGGASAQTTGSGEVASQSNPALRVYVNRPHWVDLGADPSSPDDGESWYNSSA